MADLTIENFVTKIKAMRPAARAKLDLQTLVGLILQIPDDIINVDLSTRFDGLVDTITQMQDTLTKTQQNLAQTQQSSLQNVQEIAKLKEDNAKSLRITGELSTECRKLTDENYNLKHQVEGIESYLRINNLAISGLPDPDEESGETVEQDVLNCLNGLNPETRLKSVHLTVALILDFVITFPIFTRP